MRSLFCFISLFLLIHSPLRAQEIVIDSVISKNARISICLSAGAKMQFEVERFIWNKWVQVPVSHDSMLVSRVHDFPCSLHSGENLLKIHGKINGNPFSIEKRFVNGNEEKAPYSRHGNEIVFGQPSDYEVYDQQGQIVLKGHAGSIKIDSLKRGGYYIQVGNYLGEFFRR